MSIQQSLYCYGNISPAYVGTVTSNYNDSPSSPITFDHDATGADILVVCLSYASTGSPAPTISSVTFVVGMSYVDLTRAATANTDSAAYYKGIKSELWYLVFGSDGGTNAVTVTYTGSCSYAYTTAISIMNAPSVNQNNSTAYDYGSGSSRTISVTTGSSDICIASVACPYATVTEQAGNTEIAYNSGAYLRHSVLSKINKGASTTLGWDISSYPSAHTALSITG